MKLTFAVYDYLECDVKFPLFLKRMQLSKFLYHMECKDLCVYLFQISLKTDGCKGYN